MPRRSVDPAFIDSLRGKKFCLCRQGIIAKGFYPHRDSSKNPVSNYCPHDLSSGQRPHDEFVVMKGVKFRNYSYSSSHERKINELIEQGCLIEIREERLLELTEACGFSSPSQAASILLNRSANGLDYWKDENHKTINQLEEEYQIFNKYKNGLEKISSEEKRQLVNMRIGQNILRDYLLDSRLSCPLTNITNPHLLRVSHIKPWAEFENTRLDPDNCLLLSALWDAAFDRGLITFSQEGILKFSKDIIQELDKFRPYNERISFDNIINMDNHLEYLKWHHHNVFRGNAS